MTDELRRVSVSLGALIGDGVDQPAIHCEFGLNEALLIGQKDGILRLAKAIIDSVVESTDEVRAEVNVKMSNIIGGKLDPLGEVAFDWVVITQNEDDKEKMVRFFHHE